MSHVEYISQCISVRVLPAYGTDIEEDVTGDTSGHFKKMLVVLLQVNSRDYSNESVTLEAAVARGTLGVVAEQCHVSLV